MIVIDNVGAEPSDRSDRGYRSDGGYRGDRWRWGGVCCRTSRWALLLLLLVLIYGSHAPLIALTQSDDGAGVPYSPASCVVLIELLKLLVSAATLLATEGGPGLCSGGGGVRWVLVLPYAAPAILYALNNNLVVIMQAHMDPSTFQLLSNLKIVTTATLYSSCLGKRIRPVQWLALGLLTLAGGAHSYSSLEREAGPGQGGHRGPRLHVTASGLLLLLLYCTASGLAAVITERALKSQRLPLSLQNVFLYGWGVAINVVGGVWGGEGRGFLEGFSALVWLIVIGQAAAGLMMSVVMKHGSGILRLFVISAAMLINSAASWALLGLQLTPLFLLPTGLTALAAYLYYR